MAMIEELRVNGARHRVQAAAERTLLSVLRDDLDLTGCKYGCGEGRCGACTVLVDGQPVHSCTTRVGNVADREITTVESLEKDGRLHPLQEAFLATGAMQCGYCTVGMIMSGVALLKESANPTDQEIVRVMNGNICRCGTYPRVVAAIRLASQAMKGGGQ
jgi:aerobic-type carbon monoxide dehydrogenase small subunit (CoxS/CutS family)